uniref:Uncharacterized protein n=1 Tax=Micrurus carvalhoi TaxID=3147026 RepID=A0A2H6NAA1_9SAUR
MRGLLSNNSERKSWPQGTIFLQAGKKESTLDTMFIPQKCITLKIISINTSAEYLSFKATFKKKLKRKEQEQHKNIAQTGTECYVPYIVQKINLVSNKTI